MEQNRKDLGIEILRILAMLMVLSLHYLGQGNVLARTPTGKGAYYLLWTIEAVCFSAVNIYMLISGYLLYSKRFTWRRVLSFYAEIFFYSIVLSVFSFGIHIREATYENIVSALPIVSRGNWYVTAYFAVLFIMPILNAGIEHIEQKMFRNILVAVGVLFSLVPTLFNSIDQFNINSGYSVIWYCYVYLIGAYVHLYSVQLKKIHIFFALAVILVPIPKFLLAGGSDSFFAQNSGLFYQYNSVPVLLFSLFVFLLVVHHPLKMEHNWKVNAIRFFGKTSFATFYIHSFVLLRDKLWLRLGSEKYIGQFSQIPHLLMSITVVYLACSLVEWVRSKLFDLCRINAGISKLSTKLDLKFIGFRRIV